MSQDPVARILNSAADLLEKPRRWCQGNYALRYPGGPQVPVKSPDARCFCVLGAISYAAHHQQLSNFVGDAERALYKRLGKNPAFWNDAPRRKKSEVIAALRAAAGGLP